MSAPGEFDLIARYFTRAPRGATLGIGDDCALLAPLAAGQQLAVSSDMLVEGRHFLSTVMPERLGHKALAVNLSDLAACGAAPLAFTLALAMPQVDEAFLEGFARGLFGLADAQGIELVGGDTTAGPLNICITVFGAVPSGQALLRSGARAGDALWVSGHLGDARLALEVFRGNQVLGGEAFDAVRARMELPTARVALGLALRGIASSAIDLSDGLVGDLGHVLARSGVGATVNAGASPRSQVLASLPRELQHEFTLAGGDDYELLFSAAAAADREVLAAAEQAGVMVTRIGRIEAAPGLRIVDHDGTPLAQRFMAFDHFPQPRMNTAAAQGASLRFMLRHPAHWIALGFGSGLAPRAPGTVGTLWAWAAFLLLDRWLAGWPWGLVLLAALPLGVWACARTASDLGLADPGAIVWDEVLGFWAVLWLVMPAGLIGQAIAFALFRFFDAVKPGPVGWADRRFKNARGWRQGWGIIFDDLMAALCTLLVIALARFAWPA